MASQQIGAAAVVVAGKAGKTGPGQTKPRLGTTGKPAKPKQGGAGAPGGRRPTYGPMGPLGPSSTLRFAGHSNISPNFGLFHGFWSFLVIKKVEIWGSGPL